MGRVIGLTMGRSTGDGNVRTLGYAMACNMEHAMGYPMVAFVGYPISHGVHKGIPWRTQGDPMAYTRGCTIGYAI